MRLGTCAQDQPSRWDYQTSLSLGADLFKWQPRLSRQLKPTYIIASLFEGRPESKDRLDIKKSKQNKN